MISIPFTNAPAERYFDLSLSVDLHQHSVAHTRERPIAGVTSGMMQLGDTVTWEAVHFGIRQHFTSKITAYERPYRFTDEMVRGAFQEMAHLHEFVPQFPGTLMVDVFTFRAPFGMLGRLAGRLILTRYMKGLLLTRNRYLKQVAEAGTDPALLESGCREILNRNYSEGLCKSGKNEMTAKGLLQCSKELDAIFV